MTSIAIFPTSKKLFEKASQLAIVLNLPIVEQPTTDYDFLLMVTPDYLGIKYQHSKDHPLYVDFLSKRLQYRLKNISLKKEYLARALGLKQHTQPTIVDATGGMGQDSFILAALGFEVTLLEQSSIIYQLLSDGIKRALPHLNCIQRLHIHHADSISWLKNTDPIQIVYLDPMFSPKSKSARSKKAMTIFQKLLNDNENGILLFNQALSCATERVVVKRPRTAEYITTTTKPTYSMVGRSCRFDIYLK